MEIGVIGGGMAGLSAAFYLSKRGHQITLFEKNSELGGLLSGIKIGNAYAEKYYHHLFTGDRFIIDLIDDVGLGDQLVFKKAPTAIFYQSQIHPFTSVLDLLRFDPLGIFDRLRFGSISLYLKTVNDGKKFSAVKAQDWLQRTYGQRAYQVVWEPLLRSKFGKDASSISMAWFWSRVHDRTFSLGYLEGGFQLLIEKLRDVIEGSGGEIRTRVSLTSIAACGENRVEMFLLDSGRTQEKTLDKVIVTTPLPVFLRLVKGVPDEYKNKLETIKFRSALSMVLVLKESFMEPYWLNVNDASFPFVAVVEHTNFAPADDDRGQTILYVGSYLDSSDVKLSMSAEELFDLYLPYLQKINPRFDKKWLDRKFVFRGESAQPIVTTDYESKIPPFETPVKNVYLATMAQVYPQDRGMNQAVRLGYDVAKIIAA